ncbi:hypothetical protein CDCA_CDCA09G2753 [Cyanidium caldarium]|uniref:Carboxyvinyl-carboxyphosphonate phosphorylmutase n=1 Tax=Cyanidium caldarium TaxID=2771 RepID=A0AAV9IWQ5_CYACA|nr:hypothetical protein CDCA_CDCA09G2753 [Cyanidium caldarium]
MGFILQTRWTRREPAHRRALDAASDRRPGVSTRACWRASATADRATSSPPAAAPRNQQQQAVAHLRQLLARPQLLQMPCCFDALSARMIHRAGYPLTFMSGFGVAATLGLPDTGLVSYAEVQQRAREITEAIPPTLPVIGDGDTGYGNAMNVKRTVRGFARAGLAGVLIEDQLNPKRCGHTRGKSVVDRDEALRRWAAAVDARATADDIVVVARTDAVATHGLDEALWRMQQARRLGADVLFVEAPRTVDDLQRIADALGDMPLLANMIENGMTPVLAPEQLQQLGYRIAAYPLTLLSASLRAMRDALQVLRTGRPEEVSSLLLDFAETRDIVGFTEYDADSERYRQMQAGE